MHKIHLTQWKMDNVQHNHAEMNQHVTDLQRVIIFI